MPHNSVLRQASVRENMMKGKIMKKFRFVSSLASQLNSATKFGNQNLQIAQVGVDGGVKNCIPEAYESRDSSVSEQSICSKDGNDVEVSVSCKGSNNLSPVPVFLEIDKIGEDCPSLTDFEDKCPPGGSNSIILYTTSMRSIRKTFEDCQAIRYLLQSFKVVFEERDVSMHMEFRDELWKILARKVIPPKLFIKGKYIGGADEVICLHEQGKLKKLLEGIPFTNSNKPCTCCGNLHFVVCFNCNGSRKVFTGSDYDGRYVRCGECNENGLVKCPCMF